MQFIHFWEKECIFACVLSNNSSRQSTEAKHVLKLKDDDGCLSVGNTDTVLDSSYAMYEEINLFTIFN